MRKWNATIIMTNGTLIGPFVCAESDPDAMLVHLVDGGNDSFNAIVSESEKTFYRARDVSVVRFEMVGE